MQINQINQINPINSCKQNSPNFNANLHIEPKNPNLTK